MNSLLPDNTSVFGFGSYFRKEVFSDIDLLFVVTVETSKLLQVKNMIEACCLQIQKDWGVPIDPLVITSREYREQPLRDFDQLVSLSLSPP